MTWKLTETDAHALRVFNMLQRGFSRNRVVADLKISKQWVHVLEARGRRVYEDIITKNPAGELSERNRNALTVAGCDPSKPETVKARFASLEDLKRVPNIGEKNRRDLNLWLIKHGQEPITKPNPAQRIKLSRRISGKPRKR